MKLEDLQPNIAVRGILPKALVTVVNVQWYGDNALELTYKDPAGRVSNEVLYRSDEGRLQVAEKGKPWSFDGDGKLFRLVAEAHRIRLAHLVKEKLLKFDGTPLFPARLATTVPYKLSDPEAQLYKSVTEYVRQEWRKADDVKNDKRANTVGFALTMLQRRLASSPEAIYQSLRRRRERLEKKLAKWN
jgi:hypothetical protein